MVVNPCACAIKKFGTTRDFKKAAYIMPDGKMIDFSGLGKKYRVYEHTRISVECMNGKKRDTWKSQDKGRLEWMKKCKAIRFQDCCEVEGGKIRIETLTKPTKKQMETITKSLKNHDYFFAITDDGVNECVYKAEHPTKHDVEKWVSRCW